MPQGLNSPNRSHTHRLIFLIKFNLRRQNEILDKKNNLWTLSEISLNCYVLFHLIIKMWTFLFLNHIRITPGPQITGKDFQLWIHNLLQSIFDYKLNIQRVSLETNSMVCKMAEYPQFLLVRLDLLCWLKVDYWHEASPSKTGYWVWNAWLTLYKNVFGSNWKCSIHSYNIQWIRIWVITNVKFLTLGSTSSDPMRTSEFVSLNIFHIFCPQFEDISISSWNRNFR